MSNREALFYGVFWGSFLEQRAKTGKKRMQTEEFYVIVLYRTLWFETSKMERNDYGKNQKKIGGACLYGCSHLDFLGDLYADV